MVDLIVEQGPCFTSEELKLLNRWRTLLGESDTNRTLKESFCLFQWMIKEVLNGRRICSTDSETGRIITVYESEATAALARLTEQFPVLSPEEHQRSLQEPAAPLTETLDELLSSN